MNDQPVIGITVGDPAGIGPEIVIKALIKHHLNDKYRLVVFADHAVIDQAFFHTGLYADIREVRKPDDFHFQSADIHLMNCGIIDHHVQMGQINADCGNSVLSHVSSAIEWALKGWVDAVATAPLQKESLQQGGSPYLDHTAMFKALTKSNDATTLFMVDQLRVFFLTRHIPLRDVADAITDHMLSDAIPRCLLYLSQLGLTNPVLAVAALNPHGGEDGLFGTEERNTIIPAIKKAKSAGYRVEGPIPGDSVFHLANEGRYDGVLSLYHDQGHIAAKTLDFYRTVSLTMGLPFLRTSVDHGTAFNIAGQNKANETSMIEAIHAAVLYGPIIKNSPDSS
ncbi:4-hydroxythreonine-4-phosphate dehydrogenase PdxA [bacterium]|nr:4-hydroxythreonine-4-phosphate dehydrogenase PdxA [bacterium]